MLKAEAVDDICQPQNCSVDFEKVHRSWPFLNLIQTSPQTWTLKSFQIQHDLKLVQSSNLKYAQSQLYTSLHPIEKALTTPIEALGLFLLKLIIFRTQRSSLSPVGL